MSVTNAMAITYQCDDVGGSREYCCSYTLRIVCETESLNTGDLSKIADELATIEKWQSFGGMKCPRCREFRERGIDQYDSENDFAEMRLSEDNPYFAKEGTVIEVLGTKIKKVCGYPEKWEVI